MNNRVCAIIVTWNSVDEIKRSLPAVADQTQEVIVVDNGSIPENLETLKRFVANFKNACVLENKKNLGLAAAFNRGAQYALEKEYEWFVTLDDNGRLSENAVRIMRAAYAMLPAELQKKTAIVAPNYTNLKGLVYPKREAYFVQTTVATGQLIKTDVWKKVGGFKEDLFIACVDHEFCFRVLRAGYKTLLVPNATLEATAGPKPEMKSLFGKRFVVPNYGPNRYYYWYRNSVYLYLTYFRYVPRWIIGNIYSNLQSVAKVVLFEEKKWQKLAMIARGIFDGLRGKYGELKRS